MFATVVLSSRDVAPEQTLRSSCRILVLADHARALRVRAITPTVAVAAAAVNMSSNYDGLAPPFELTARSSALFLA